MPIASALKGNHLTTLSKPEPRAFCKRRDVLPGGALRHGMVSEHALLFDQMSAGRTFKVLFELLGNR